MILWSHGLEWFELVMRETLMHVAPRMSGLRPEKQVEFIFL